MKNPLISVVMPNYNGSKYLARAIESFLAENYDEKELLIVDGKSTDGSHNVISDYSERYETLVKWIKTPDKGISDAINIAINVSQGEIIGYLGSDDLLSGDVFQKIARWEPFVDFDAVFFNSYTYYVEDRKCVLQRPSTLEINTENLLRRGTIVGLQNTFYRRRFFENIKFNVENRYSMDYEMLLEAAARNALFFYIDSVATLNYFDGNISHNNAAQMLEAAYVARRFCGDYDGPLFGEDLLPEGDRRPEPTPDSAESNIDVHMLSSPEIQTSNGEVPTLAIPKICASNGALSEVSAIGSPLNSSLSKTSGLMASLEKLFKKP